MRDNNVQDSSNVNFTVTSRIAVTAPNTPVAWTAGATRTVTWTHNYGSGQAFDVAFSANAGGTWQSLATGVAAATATTGNWTGVLPAVVTSQALIRVSPAGHPGDGDVSNVVFTLVAPTIAVTLPNTAVSWAIGSNQTVSWTHNLGTGESVRIESSAGRRGDLGVVTASVANTAAASGSVRLAGQRPAPVTSAVRIRAPWTRDTIAQDSQQRQLHGDVAESR